MGGEVGLRRLDRKGLVQINMWRMEVEKGNGGLMSGVE